MQGPVNESSPTEERIGICIETTVNTSVAVSPAFVDGRYQSCTDWKRTRILWQFEGDTQTDLMSKGP